MTQNRFDLGEAYERLTPVSVRRAVNRNRARIKGFKQKWSKNIRQSWNSIPTLFPAMFFLALVAVAFVTVGMFLSIVLLFINDGNGRLIDWCVDGFGTELFLLLVAAGCSLWYRRKTRHVWYFLLKDLRMLVYVVDAGIAFVGIGVVLAWVLSCLDGGKGGMIGDFGDCLLISFGILVGGGVIGAGFYMWHHMKPPEKAPVSSRKSKAPLSTKTPVNDTPQQRVSKPPASQRPSRNGTSRNG